MVVPCELGDFADEVQVFSLIASLGVNVVHVDVVPQRDGLSLLILCVDSVFEGIFLASNFRVESLVASERALLLEGLSCACVLDGYQLFSFHLF